MAAGDTNAEGVIEVPEIRLGPPQKLKGGENHHQDAYAFRLEDENGEPLGSCALDAEDLGAKVRDMGWTNACDAGTCLRTYTDMGQSFYKPAEPYFACASKHGRIVIAAGGRTQKEALMRAFAADVNSPFGGIFGFNTPVERETAEILDRVFMEGVIAPGYEDGVPDMLKDTSRVKAHANRFILKMPRVSTSDINAMGWDMRFAGCCMIAQEYDSRFFAPEECTVAAPEGLSGLSVHNIRAERGVNITHTIQFAGNMARHLNSNLIVYAASHALIGFGNSRGARYLAARDGRANMEESVWNALTLDTDEAWERALYDTPFARDDFMGLDMDALVAFSDAFYPKPDAFIESLGIDRVHEDFRDGRVQCCGEEIVLKRKRFDPYYTRALVAKTVVQPGGCMGDKYTLDMSRRYKVPMVFTMTPEQFAKYPKDEQGKSITGRRFFSHQSF